MKIITLQQIGYNHPSQANWSYAIYSINMIDTERDYCQSLTVKACFGSESILKNTTVNNCEVKTIEVKSVFPLQKITGIRSIDNIDDRNVLDEVVVFLTK